jgi:TRAP-type C4-dicarboxylate transport system permease small subunit
VQRILDFVDSVLQKIVIGTMAFMLFFTFIQVVARYLFQSSLVFSEELSRYLFVWTVFLGLPVVAKRGGHMAVTAVSGKLRGHAARIVSVAAYVVSIAFMILMIVQGVGMVERTSQQLSPAMEIRMSLVYLAIPIGCFFMAVRIIADLVGLLRGKGESA